jgi:F0F1-type ATP synthase gamma subunit
MFFFNVESSLVDVPDQPSFKSIQAIAKHAIDLFSEEHIDKTIMLYSSLFVCFSLMSLTSRLSTFEL